ncbi:MAG: hypothetical protein QOK09_3570, partial [Mycobacterium sp.]|nr:hypothetical protein [Mycobacterium sp.]
MRIRIGVLWISCRHHASILTSASSPHSWPAGEESLTIAKPTDAFSRIKHGQLLSDITFHALGCGGSTASHESASSSISCPSG